MPEMTRKDGQPRKSRLPGTLRRSAAKARRTFAKAHDNAARQYGEGARAYRVAWSAVKRRFRKSGDRWVRREGRGGG